MSHHTTQAIGKKGEDIVARCVQQRGWRILGRNIHARRGELDIIALADDGVIHVIEVKTRRSTLYGEAIEALGFAKFQKMRLAWEDIRLTDFAASDEDGRHSVPHRYRTVQYDFAAVSVVVEQGKRKARVEWVWNIGHDDFY